LAEALTKTMNSIESANAFADSLSKKEAAAAETTLAQVNFGAEENFDGLW